MTSRACFFHRFRTLISFCLRLLRKFSLWLLSLTDRTLPRNRRQLRPSSGLQNTLTQNWRELRPSSDLQNSLPKNWRELRPSNGLQTSLPKNGERSVLPTACRAACQKKCGRSVLLVTYTTTSQKNGAGSFHGDSDCKHFSDSVSFRASVGKLVAMISAVNSTCLCFCFCVVCCCWFCFCSAARVHGGTHCSYFPTAHTGLSGCVGVRQ